MALILRPDPELPHRQQQQQAEEEEQAEQRPRGSRKRKAAKWPSRQARPQAEDAMEVDGEEESADEADSEENDENDPAVGNLSRDARAARRAGAGGYIAMELPMCACLEVRPSQRLGGRAGVRCLLAGGTYRQCGGKAVSQQATGRGPAKVKEGGPDCVLLCREQRLLWCMWAST